MRRVAFAGTAVLATLVFVECGKPPCDARACSTGCCDKNNNCVVVQSDNACGTGGRVCTDCTQANNVCLFGECKAKGSVDAGPPCYATTCPNGCCDSNGCRLGTADTLCGRNGQACVDCAAIGEICLTNTCATVQRDGGADGGAATCTQMASFATQRSVGLYVNSGNNAPPEDFNLAANLAPNPNQSTVDVLRIEAWHGYAPGGGPITNGATLTLTTSETFQQCYLCVFFNEGCDPQNPASCARKYFGQGGTVTVDQIVRDPQQGVFKASGSTLKFVEWDFTNDKPAPNAKCVDLAAATWDVTWSTDAGTPACSAATCPTGCCDTSGTCQPGTNDVACGTSAASCANCSASSQVCTGQACTGPPVSDGGASD